jgi:hypothetical protein
VKASQTIPRSGAADLATSYQTLLSRGLAYCQKLAGDIWTDYNEHDPGVTILEHLCYALTDLSYRADYEIPDILASPSGTPRPENSLYTGDRILTSSPITPNDYRNLLYDRIKGLKNAWLVPVTDHPLGVQGTYHVLIELREEIEDPEGPEAMEIKNQALKLMRQRRNLGEDIYTVEILKPQPIRIDATVIIEPHSEPANVLARVLFEIQNSMIPFPQIQRVDELFQKMSPEDIWSGPALDHGALDQRSLRPIQTTVRVQEIANIMLKVRGVKRVKDLMVGNVGGEMTADSLPLEKHHVPRIDPPILQMQPGYTIQMELEGGFKVLPDARAVWSKIRELEAEMRSSIAYAARSLSALSYLKVPTGIDRKIESYFSIQHQFPAIYGLGRFGMSNGLIETRKGRLEADAQHRARIRQLRAYLLFFEQLLADNLAQLAHVSELFSLNEELDRSYFYQPLAHDPPHPDDPPNIVEVLLQDPGDPGTNAARYQVCVVDPRGEIVFTSRIQTGLVESEETRRQIAECGQSIDYYQSSTAASREVRLALYGRDNTVLAHGQERFTSIAASREAAKHWVRFFVQLQGDAELLESSIKIFSQEHFGFQVVDERSRIVLLGRRASSPEERDRRIEEMLDCGADEQCYRLLMRGQGEFEVGLLNREGMPIARGSEAFATQRDAESGIIALLVLIESMAAERSSRDRHLRILPEVEEVPGRPLSAYNRGLAKLARSMDRDDLLRRNRFLDHLLARFAEQFDDEILVRLDLRPYGERDGFYAELIRWKIDFLREYVQQSSNLPASVGGGRARGFDYSDTTDSGAGSSFERRIGMLLGIKGHMAGDGYRLNSKQPASKPGYFYMEKDSNRPRAEGEPDARDLHGNFVFSSADSSVFRVLLASCANPNSFQVEPAGHEYKILFQSPESKEPIAIHHAPTRAEADKRVAALVRYFREMRSNSAEWYREECLYLVEHILLRPQDGAEECRVHLPDGKARVQLSSVSIPKKEKEEHARLILEHGQKKANYRARKHSSGKYYLVLYGGDREIAAGKQWFDMTQVENAKTELASLVRRLAAQPQARETILKTTVTDDFYSHRISIFFPNWPMRFQNDEFKLYAEQIVCENAPAHLAVDCYWLAVAEMQEFEQDYGHWRKLKCAFAQAEGKPGHGVPSATELNQQAAKLKAFIERLQLRERRGEHAHAGQPPAGGSGGQAGQS